MNVRWRVAGWLLAGSAFLLAAPSAWGDGEITIGSQQWSQTAPEAKYQEFVNYPQGSFLYSLFLIQGQGRNQISIVSRNVLQKDQFTDFTWKNGARFRLDVMYGQIPHNFSQVSRSPYTENEWGRLVLDNNIRQTNQADGNDSLYTAKMTDYLASAPGLPLTHRTDRYGARAKYRPALGWSVEGKVVQQKKTGNKAYGGAFGFNSAIEIWEPIKHRTTDAEVSANYKNSRMSLRAAGGVSIFENMISDLIWDNPKRITDTTYSRAYVPGDGPAQGRLDLYPDNKAYYGSLALSFRLPQRTALSGTVGLRQTFQDDAWLPFTTNTAITEVNDPANALPGTKTDAKASAFTADVRLATRALGPVGANARFRYYDFSNRTPSYNFPGYVRFDAVWEDVPLTSHPFGNRRTKVSADFNYRPVPRLYLEAGGEWNQRDHTLREVERDQEVAGFARFTAGLTQRLSFEGYYRYGNRVADDFLIEHYQNEDSSFHEQPGLRRFDVANRRQQIGEAKLNLLVNQTATALVRYQYTRNLFPDSEFGLKDQQGDMVGLDVTLDPEAPVTLVGGGGWAQSDALQESRTSGGSISTDPSSNWTATLRDRNWYAYADLEWDLEPDVWTLDLGYEFSWARGEYLFSNPTDTAEDLPPTEYIRHLALANLEYRMWRNTDVGIRYAYDNYKVEDFANQNIPLINPGTAAEEGGTANAIFLGDNALPYTAHRVAIYLTRNF